jgi:TatD DNase family protein
LEDIENLDEALRRAEESGVIAVVTMGSDYESNLWALKESVKHQREKLAVHPAIGLHPWGLDPSKIGINLRLIEENIGKAVSVGEIGLDYWYKEVRKNSEKKAEQRELFRSLLEIAERNGKPVSIHSRGAWADSVDIAIETSIKKAVFHWFSGSLNILERLLDQGYYVSATPAAAYSKEHRAVVEKTPLDRLLLETDSPVKYGGEPSEPAHILKTLSAVAEVKKLREETVAEKTTENADLFFNI